MPGPIKEWRYLFPDADSAERFAKAAQNVVMEPVRLYRWRAVSVHLTFAETQMHEGRFFIWSRDLGGERLYTGPVFVEPVRGRGW